MDRMLTEILRMLEELDASKLRVVLSFLRGLTGRKA